MAPWGTVDGKEGSIDAEHEMTAVLAMPLKYERIMRYPCATPIWRHAELSLCGPACGRSGQRRGLHPPVTLLSVGEMILRSLSR